MRASAQIHTNDAGRRKRVKCEMGGLFGLGTREVWQSVTTHANMRQECLDILPGPTCRLRDGPLRLKPCQRAPRTPWCIDIVALFDRDNRHFIRKA